MIEFNYIEFVAIVFGLVALSTVCVYVLAKRRHRLMFEQALIRESETAAADMRLLQERIDIKTRDIGRHEVDVKRLQNEVRALAESEGKALTRVAGTVAENKQLTQQLQTMQKEMSVVRKEAADANVRSTEVVTQLKATEKSFAEKESLFRETGETLKGEFQLLANKIFERQGESFRVRSEKQLANVLQPFREQIKDFRERVEQVATTDAKDRASLLTEVRNLQHASERVNLETENLTRALKGDKRVQGNWGEVVLERVLEESGLRRGHEYEVQVSQRNEEGDLKRPDVIIRLPDDKDVVIDSKVSLSAYERALSVEDDDEREAAWKTHVANLRLHVKRLSEQNYDHLPGIRSLDFVLLFVPVEAAFTLAMERDPALFTEAFERRLVVVSPTTLMMTLRIIDNVWRYEKQSKNAQEIARRAGALYDKLRLLVEDMEKIGNNLSSATRSFDSAYARLATGRGNLVRRVEQFRELGANVKTPLAKSIVDDADDE